VCLYSVGAFQPAPVPQCVFGKDFYIPGCLTRNKVQIFCIILLMYFKGRR
jgi:hypothetical protein